MQTPVLIFDVNETLLDLKALDEHFVALFGDAAARREWFAQFIHTAFIATITGQYHPFGQIGMAALANIAARRGRALTDADKQRIGGALAQLPPHPEVRAGLESLRAAGFRLAALTNSTLAVATSQLTNAGLIDLFERVLSADTVQRLKPAPEPYHHAAQAMGVPIQATRLVAAHAWDVAGALAAGAAAAFIARPGMMLDPLFAAPPINGADLTEVASQIIAAG